MPLIPGLLLLCLVAFAEPAAARTEQSPTTSNLRETLAIPIAVYILEADDDTDLSSRRSTASIEEHYGHVNNIWRQANIHMKPVSIQRVTVPSELLSGLAWRRGRGGIARFFSAIRHGEIDIQNNRGQALVSAFYVRTLGGPNGLKPLGANALFVADNTSNDDFRVTSHELGHILRLHHPINNPDLLMFQGSNGQLLRPVEQTVARYAARGLYHW